MMFGPVRGGCVRLGEAGELLAIGEGTEATVSFMQATGMPAWAALSTSGMRALDLPDSVREVVVLADGDDPGEAAARAARPAMEARGPAGAHRPAAAGLDFNDVLVRGCAVQWREGLHMPDGI